jgi:hypothetical protein
MDAISAMRLSNVRTAMRRPVLLVRSAKTEQAVPSRRDQAMLVQPVIDAWPFAEHPAMALDLVQALTCRGSRRSRETGLQGVGRLGVSGEVARILGDLLEAGQRALLDVDIIVVNGHNRTLEAPRLVPAAILFGTDGAGELYAVEPDSESYYTYPTVGLSADLGRELGNLWGAFLQALSTTS